MTWFRMECDVGTDELWEELGQRLDIAGPQAFGHYAWFVGMYGERWVRGKISGRLADLQDGTIEKWAGWAGFPGGFATALKDLCTDPATGELKGFRRRNEKILLKQIRDAKTKPARGSAPEPARVMPLVSPHNQRVDEDVDGYGRTPVLPPAGASHGGSEVTLPLDHTRYTVLCTAAANRGLRENTQVAGFNELVTSNQLEETRPWYDSGIPIDVAQGAIYHRARSYRPRGRRLQPTTLGYFRECVEESHARGITRAIEGGVTTALPAEADPLAGWVAEQEARRARQG